MSKYQIIKGSTFGDWAVELVLVGYDSDTGEEEYEEEYYRKWKPHEDVLSEHDSYDEARSIFQELCETFENEHRWPWNNPSITFENGSCKTEYSDNEDSVWFIIKEKLET